MKKIILCLLGFIVFNNAVLATTTDDNIDKIMHNLMHKYAIPGAAVLFYKDGKVTQHLFGVMNKKTHAPVRSTTIFELGSVTKTFSALLLAQNVGSGEMSLDDKLVDYLDNSDGYSDSLKQITLLELATYTSGLPFNIDNMSYNGATNSRNQKVLNQFLHTWVAPYTPGTAERYSNPGFALLGMAMADYEEAPLAQVMQNNILQPLNMNSSFLTIPANKMKFYSGGYDAKGSPSRSPQGGLLAGSWAMKASVTDMEQYLRLALGLDNMPPKLVTAMKIAQTGYFENEKHQQIGLAWMVNPLDKVDKAELLKVVEPAPRKHNESPVSRIGSPKFNGNALIEKTGSTNGFRAYIGVIPGQKIGVVILVNRFLYDDHVTQHTGRELLLNN